MNPRSFADPLDHRRCRRLNIPGHAHCLTFACFHGIPLLRSEALCNWLAEAVDRARERESFDLWAYVFMPEHVHLLLKPRQEEYSVSRILTAIKRPVAYRALGELKASENPLLARLVVQTRAGASHRLWQAGGGHDRNLVEAPAIHAMLEYIHNNPVRRGLAESAVDWGWSSARDWADLGAGPLRIDRTLPMLLQ